MRVEQPVLKFKATYRIPASINPESATSEMERIREKYKALTPQVVVKESRRKASPLHNYFEWDNDKAGEKYRQEQARRLIRAIVVTEPDQEERSFYVNVTVEDRREYKPLHVVVDVTDELTDAINKSVARVRSAVESAEEMFRYLEKNGKVPTKAQKMYYKHLKKAEQYIEKVAV